MTQNELMLQMFRGVQKCYLSRNSSHVLMLPLHSTIITPIAIDDHGTIIRKRKTCKKIPL